MGHKSHHHSKEKDRGRNKHRHHKSHSRRSSSQSSVSSTSSSSYSSSDSYSHHSHKKRKHHHRHHKEKEKSKKTDVSKEKRIDKDSPSINKNENEKKLVGPSLPSDFNNIPKKEEIKNDSTNNDNEKKFVGPVLPSFLQNKDNESSDEDSNESNNDSSALIGPSLPSSFNNENAEQNKRVVGPSLPPFVNNENAEQKKRVVGPSLPPSMPNVEIKVKEESESDDDIIGPLPIAPGQELTEEEETQRIIKEFEERADRMKRKLEGKDEPEKPKKLVRDEWMTTLPEDNILDRINVMKPRQFRKNGITKIDRSGWTDTPADKLRKQKEGIKDKDEKVEYIQINKKDQEMERMVEQYNREHRSESLYDQHAKEYFKNKKYEENDISKLPFNRERDVLGAGSKGSIGKTNALKGVLGTESANRFTHSTTKRFL